MCAYPRRIRVSSLCLQADQNRHIHHIQQLQAAGAPRYIPPLCPLQSRKRISLYKAAKNANKEAPKELILPIAAVPYPCPSACFFRLHKCLHSFKRSPRNKSPALCRLHERYLPTPHPQSSCICSDLIWSNFCPPQTAIPVRSCKSPSRGVLPV